MALVGLLGTAGAGLLAATHWFQNLRLVWMGNGYISEIKMIYNANSVVFVTSAGRVPDLKMFVAVVFYLF